MRLAILAILASLSIVLSPLAGQQDSAVVRPEMAEYEIEGSSEVEVVFLLENASDVYAIDVQASYDPALIEIVDADSAKGGVQVQPGQFPQPDLVVTQDANASAGTVRYVVTQLNPTPPANGSGVLFTVRVRGRAGEGIGDLQINRVEMSDRDGNLLPVEWAGVVLQVTGSATDGQGAVPTGVAIVPTDPPRAASATPTTATRETPSPASSPVLTMTPAPPAHVTEVAATAQQTSSASVMNSATAPPSSVADAEGGGEVAPEPATEEGIATPASAITSDESTAAATHEIPDSATESTAPGVVADRNASGSAESEVESDEIPDFAVIGEGETGASTLPASADVASSEQSTMVWPLLFVGGLAVVLLVGVAVLFSRRSG